MKKKGFTLVELLATIVILSVIALIATPIVLNVIESSKKSALVTSVKGLVESAKSYYTNEILKGDITEDTVFDFEKGTQTSDTKLSYKGKVYNGKLILTSDSDVVTCIDDGKYYAYKELDSDKVMSGKGTCVYDGTTGDFDIMTDGDAELIQKQCDIDKNKLQEEIDKLKNEIAEKEAAIEELQGSSSAKDNEILILQGEKEELEKSLKELTDKITSVTATAEDVLAGKTILTSSGIVTGTMANYSNQEVDIPSENVTDENGYISVKLPINGYANDTQIKINKDDIDITDQVIDVIGNLSNSVLKSGAQTTSYTAVTNQYADGYRTFWSGERYYKIFTNDTTETLVISVNITDFRFEGAESSSRVKYFKSDGTSTIVNKGIIFALEPGCEVGLMTNTGASINLSINESNDTLTHTATGNVKYDIMEYTW